MNIEILAGFNLIPKSFKLFKGTPINHNFLKKKKLISPLYCQLDPHIYVLFTKKRF